MTRIRYEKDADQLIFTNILTDRGMVCGLITTNTLMFFIQNQEYGTLAKGQGRNLADCKKKVKSALKLLGARFDDEIRNRGKTQKL